MARPMLEREHELATLAAAAREAAGGGGSVVLVSGEAGIGKSSLVEATRAVLPAEGRLLVGWCDDLGTPRTLGPLRDLVGHVGTGLTGALDAGDRTLVMERLRAELDRSGRPSVLVIEDAHWADEATLDVVRYLVRRMAALPAVLLLTYRDDELGADHPMRQVIGLASRMPRLHRLPLSRLSPAAVRRLGAAGPLDPGHVFSVTGGNPFFVNEVLAAGDTSAVPATISAAVAGRVAELPAGHRDVLEQLAVVPSAVEWPLLDAMVPDAMAAITEAEQRGIVTVTPERVAFRHELTRRAIVDAMPPARAVDRNRRALAALTRKPGADLSRIMHHAVLAGDVDAVVEHGPAAAAEAARAGSHREAAAHYARVLAHADRFAIGLRGPLLQGFAVESYLLARSDDALAAQRAAVGLFREVGEPIALGAGLRWLSRMCWWAGERSAADDAAAEAIRVLVDAGDDGLLAFAMSNRAQLHFLGGRLADAVATAEVALDLARKADDPATVSHALNNLGSARWEAGDPGGRAELDESLRVALAAGEVEHACRAYVNLVWALMAERRAAEADDVLAAAIALAEEAEYIGFLRYLQAELALLRLAQGRWDEAAEAADQGLDAQAPVQCPALTVLGLVRIRRGEPGGDELLERAWRYAVRSQEAQRLGPVAAALAEAAWLRGDDAGMARAVEGALDAVAAHGSPSVRAELARWADPAGRALLDPPADHPSTQAADGHWAAAAAAWEAAGYPYEQAATLALSPEADDRLAALAILDGLGAEPLARKVRIGLRELGVARIPRGPQVSTRANPAGLTARQLEILRLITEGLTNQEIAARLVVSVRTVDNHVSAVLEKLSVPGRREAAAKAAELGVVG